MPAVLTGESNVLQDTNCELIYEDPEDEQIDSSYANQHIEQRGEARGGMSTEYD